MLGVEGADAVMAAAKQCWRSASSDRVRAHQAVAPVDTAPMAILVQRLVPADAAGVAFTANPITGEREQTMVSAVKGLGDRLVSGLATPDEWSIRDGRAVTLRAREQAITEAQSLEVAALARRVEAYFGAPQDIEWAYAGDRLFLLQARPITALPPALLEPPAETMAVPPGYWERDASPFPEPCSPAFRAYYNCRSNDQAEPCRRGVREDECWPSKRGGARPGQGTAQLAASLVPPVAVRDQPATLPYEPRPAAQVIAGGPPTSPADFLAGDLTQSLRRGAEVQRFAELAATQNSLTPAESDELYRYRLRRLLTRIRRLIGLERGFVNGIVFHRATGG